MLNNAKLIERSLLAALALLACGLLGEAYRVGLWRADLPGPGFFPAGLLVLIAAISMVLIFSRSTSGPAPGRTGRMSDVAAIGGALLLVPLLLPLLGFRLVAFVFAFGLMVFLAQRLTLWRLASLALLSVALAVGTDNLFATVFRVFLPVGRLTGI